MSEQPMVRIPGPVAVEGSLSTEPLNPRLRCLVAVLAAQPGRAIPESTLVDALWGEGELPASPTRSLQTYVSRIRAHLGAEAIERVATSYRLVADRIGIDAEDFERLVGQAGSARDRGEDRAAAELLDRALGLWSGPALGEFADEHWAGGAARRLGEMRADAREQRAEVAVDLGRVDGVLLGELEQMVVDHPHREEPTRLLMLALHQVNRQADALAAFGRYRDQLATDLGLEPSAALRQLEEQILVDDRAAVLTRTRPLRGYEIVERLGEGAFSIVYRGRQPVVGRDVAIKQIRAELANRPEFIRRFETEAHLVARLEYPFIVPLYDYWREPDSAYLVMRYLRGGSLESSLRAGPWELDRTLAMVSEIGAALAVAHRSGVVHRDVKPANILLDEDGHAYLTDFGIALDAEEAADPEAALSAGSPAYASPEQLRREQVGPPADVHGLAIATFETLTGRLPFPDEPSRAALLKRQLHDPIPAVSAVRADVPVGVDAVLARATAKDPTDRFATIEAFLGALQEATDPAPWDALGSAGRGFTGPSVGRRAMATAVSDGERNPYKGLRAFDEADETDFAGRDRLVDQLIEVLAANRLVAVVGPSGSGKSSVVRAGLLPALRKGRVAGSDRWYATTVLPGANPFEELETALLRVAAERPADLLGVLESGSRGIARGVRHVAPQQDDEVLVVVDQFEELFTLADPAEVARFLDALAVAVTEERPRLRVVLTLRADFYDRPLRHESIGRLVRDATVAVLPLAADELEHAIVDPAASVGAEFEPGLVSEIVADVADQPGALPLMQYALTELYEQRVSGLLTRDAYRALGGVAGALARRADDLWLEMPADEQTVARRVFGRLVALGEGTEDTRRRALRSELGDEVAVAEVLDRFGHARLLSFDVDPQSREPTIEVAHEALIREWPRLREWLDEDRDGLRILRHLHTASREWEASGRPEAELYRGGRLEAAEEYAAGDDVTLHPVERAFLDSCVTRREAEAEAERRVNRRLRGLLVGVAVVAAMALIAGAVAFQQRASAEETAFDASTRRLVADAAALVETNPDLALLLAREAWNRDPGPVTESGLLRTLTRTGPWLGLIGAGADFLAAEWMDDGTIVGLTETDLRFYDGETHELVSVVDLPAAAWSDLVTQGGLAVSGDLIAVAQSDGTVAVVSGSEVSTVVVAERAITSVAMSADGHLLAAGDQGGQVSLVELPAGEIRWTSRVIDHEGYADVLPPDTNPMLLDTLTPSTRRPSGRVRRIWSLMEPAACWRSAVSRSSASPWTMARPWPTPSRSALWWRVTSSSHVIQRISCCSTRG